MWHYFPEHYMFSYQLIRILTQSHYGGGEFNQCLEAASKIQVGNRHSFYEAWAEQGEKAFAEAETASAENRLVTARAAYLRASNYLRTAEFFLELNDADKLPAYLKAVEAFRKSIVLWDNKPEVITIPYEDSFLPGYLFKATKELAPNSPLIIMFGGLDSCAEEMWYGPGALLNERGISLLVIDGPGQGGALRLNNIHTRYDYEVPATLAFDWVLENYPIFDPNRIGIMAVSMGGYMAARAAAFEPRFKTCAIWGAVWSYYDIWKNRPDNHPLAPIVMHIVDAHNMEEAREKIKQFTLDGVAEKISMPTYISHGEDDRQNFVENAYKTYDALTCEKYINIVPKGSTGSAHCHVDDFTKAFPMLDWLQKTL
jgi:hypothetical protein